VTVNDQMRDVNPGKQQNGITNLTVQANGYFNERPDNTDGDTGGTKSMYNVGDWGAGATNSGYVGLVMVNNGVTNFGWAHFTWTDPSSDSADTNAQLTLIDGAYESSPNTGILTGQSTCAAPGSPNSAAGWFQLFQQKNDWAWSGADQVTSYRAGNGLDYWLFGDTVLGTRNPATGGYQGGWTMVANTILVESNGVLSRATATAPAVPNAANGDRFWTQGIFEANGFVYALCAQVRNTNSGIGFILRGSELAKFSLQSGGQLTFLNMVPTPGTGIDEGIGPSAIQWAADAVVYDGYVYVFGNSKTGNPYVPQLGYVSRAPTVSLETPSAWQFWNGTSWNSTMSSSAPILADMISGVRPYNGVWVMLHKPFSGWGSSVYAEIAPAPQGPYSSTQIIFDSPAGQTANGVTTNLHSYVTYSPQPHPEYPLASGKLLISIAWNGNDLFQDVANDAELYKPRFYEVVLTGAPVYLNAKNSGDSVILSWPLGTLLEASTLAGPWITNHAAAPCTNSLVPGGRFYRVQVR
jgi:hypothetical protein